MVTGAPGRAYRSWSGRCDAGSLRHAEGVGFDDAVHEGADPIVLRFGVADDLAHRRHVERLDAAAERIGHQAAREAQEARRPCGAAARRAGHPGPRSTCRRTAGPSCRPSCRRRECATCRSRRSSRAPGRADRSRDGTTCTADCCDAAPCARAPSAAGRNRPCLSSLRAPARSAAAVAAAIRAALPSPTCRAAPARCARRSTSASGCCRGRGCRGDRRAA